MKARPLRKSLPVLFLLSTSGAGALFACGGGKAPPSTPTTASSSVASAASVASSSAAQPVTSASAAAAQPSAEDKKKADAKQLEEDRAKWDAAHKKELARWTPEMHAATKALVDKTYPNAHAALAAIVAGKHRNPENVARDKYRHPIETLEFFGVQPTMKVVDIGPGEGWYTEILAPFLAKKGRYFATGADPSGPADLRPTFYAQRFMSFLSSSEEAYGQTAYLVLDGKTPVLDPTLKADMVLIMRGVHGMVNAGTFEPWLAQIAGVLKPGGVLGIEEHRAKPDADPKESAKKGYVPEKFVVDTVTAAGFTLDKKSEINANPKDTKDYAEGVWTLPPTFRLGDKDHDKYAAIGESDRMTLRFVKKAAPSK